MYKPRSDTKPVPESLLSKSPARVTTSVGLEFSNDRNCGGTLLGSLEGGRFRFASSSAKHDGHMEAWSGNRKKDRYGSYTCDGRVAGSKGAVHMAQGMSRSGASVAALNIMA
jgi:hypothetical protein